MIHIKICCISSIEEANLAISMGASAIGLVSEMPSGPGVIPDSLAGEIVRILPNGIDSFLLTSKTDAKSIIEQQSAVGASTIQICDQLPPGHYEMLRSAIPHVKLVQVVHVNGEESITSALQIAPKVDAILLDSGNPNLESKELGGTGRTHNWEISRMICESVRLPIYLAGGLNSTNVIEAIKRVRPFGVDVCSGVRTNDKLDRDKLSAFLRAASSSI